MANTSVRLCKNRSMVYDASGNAELTGINRHVHSRSVCEGDHVPKVTVKDEVLCLAHWRAGEVDQVGAVLAVRRLRWYDRRYGLKWFKLSLYGFKLVM